MEPEPGARSSTRQSFKFAGRTHDFIDGDVVQVPKAPYNAFLFVVAVYYGSQWTETDVALAFLRSLAHCPTPIPKVPGNPKNGSWPSGRLCPAGSFYEGPLHNDNFTTSPPSSESFQDAASLPGYYPGFEVEGECLAFLAGEPGWSYSITCMNKNYVVLAAYKMIGSIVTWSQLGAVLSSMFFGAALIDTWGRKPLMLVSFGAQILNTAMFCIVQLFDLTLDSDFTYALLITGALFASCLNTFAASAAAMVVDGTAPDSNERSTRLVVFSVLRSVATMANVGTTWLVLNINLTTYAVVWPVYGGVLIVQLIISSFLLVETAPVMPESAKPKTWWKTVSGQICAMFEICTSDRRLHVGIWNAAVGGATFGVVVSMAPNWIVLVLDLSQATASLGSAYASFFTILGSAASGTICIKYGQLKCIYISQTLTIIGFAVIPAGAYLPGWEGILWWIGIGPILAFGVGMSSPALFALLSSRVAPENQGKFFSGLTLAVLAMSSLLMYVWTQYFVHPESLTPVEDMTFGWFVGAIVEFGVFVAVYLTFGCEYTEITMQGSQLNFMEGVSGSRILAPEEGQLRPPVLVADY